MNQIIHRKGYVIKNIMTVEVNSLQKQLIPYFNIRVSQLKFDSALHVAHSFLKIFNDEVNRFHKETSAKENTNYL